jgi:hypothetical protein
MEGLNWTRACSVKDVPLRTFIDHPPNAHDDRAQAQDWETDRELGLHKKDQGALTILGFVISTNAIRCIRSFSASSPARGSSHDRRIQRKHLAKLRLRGWVLGICG